MSTTVSVIIGDDDPLVREALLALLRDDDRVRVVGVATSGDEAAALVASLQPRIALLDLRMPSGGAEGIRAVLDASPSTRVVVLSAYDDVVTATEAMRAGAVGFLPKGRLAHDLPEVLLRCASGETVLEIDVGPEFLTEISRGQP